MITGIFDVPAKRRCLRRHGELCKLLCKLQMILLHIFGWSAWSSCKAHALIPL
jgi:hypothetical protein